MIKDLPSTIIPYTAMNMAWVTLLLYAIKNVRADTGMKEKHCIVFAATSTSPFLHIGKWPWPTEIEMILNGMCLSFFICKTDFAFTYHRELWG